MRKRSATIIFCTGAVLLAAFLAGREWSQRSNPTARTGSTNLVAANPGNSSPTGPAVSQPRGEPRHDDFVGAEACVRCHAREYELWRNSTHGKAGGAPNEVGIIAKFDGRPLRFSDAVVTPTTNMAGQYVFLIDEPGEPRAEVRVDAVVGGGHMIGGGTQSFFTRFADGTYRFLPFDFIRREDLWFVQLQRDMSWAPVSAQLSLLNDLANWPPRRVLGTASEFSNCQNCHGSQITLQYNSGSHAYETKWQTLRINCESCHGGGRRHIELVSRPGWEKDSDIGVKALASLAKKESMETCYQCHASKDALRDDPFLPGMPLEEYFSLKLGLLKESPFLVDGRVRSFSYQSGHEFSDCYLNGSMTCTDCHDPHAQGYRDFAGRPLAGRFDNGQCTGCHASKGLAAEAHSHHGAGTTGNQCVACHMPYLQHRGVGQHLAFARSDHSIPIPRPRFDQSLGIENACQKCHRDKDLAWQQSHVDAWYGTIKPHPRLIATLAATNEPATMREAATAYLLPSEIRHPMAQAAGLSRFIQKYLRPDLPSMDAEVEKRLKAFTTDSDVDLQAMALMALQVGYVSTPSIQAFVKERLQNMKENDPVRRRWAICADHLGGIFGAKGDLSAATVCFERGLEVEPRNEVILSHLALAYFRGGKPEAAVAALKKAIEVRPTKAVLHFQLAQIYAQLQRFPESIAALQSGLVHAPHDGNARAMLQQLQGR